MSIHTKDLKDRDCQAECVMIKCANDAVEGLSLKLWGCVFRHPDHAEILLPLLHDLK